MSDEYKPSDPQLVFALDRAWIWKQAHKTMTEAGYEPDPSDVLDLAEFMSGDHIPGGFNMEETDSSSDGEVSDVAE